LDVADAEPIPTDTKPIVPGSWKTTWATFRLNNGGFLKDPRKTGNKKTPTGRTKILGEV